MFNSATYILSEDNVAALVDCGDITPELKEIAKDIKGIFLTHTHFDHIYGLNEICRINPSIKVFTNEYGSKALVSDKLNMSRYHETPFVFAYPSNVVTVADGETVELGDGLTARAMFTPGHNASCVTWVTDNYVFSGDSLIPGVKTVTNLPGGDRRQAAESEALIRRLAEGRTLCPGHAPL